MRVVIAAAYPSAVNAPATPRRFRDRLLHDAGGEFAVAAVYVGAWLFAPWLSDGALLALVVAVALQFFFVTMILGAITPRGARGIFWAAAGHGVLLALLWWVASGGARQPADWLAIATAQAPLLLRTLARRARPDGAPAVMWLEMLGPFFLLMPVVIVAVVLDAVTPLLGLAGRTLQFRHLAPLAPDQLKFILIAGAVYFAGYGVARTAWESLGGEEHRRADLDASTIARWRAEYLRSRRR